MTPPLKEDPNSPLSILRQLFTDTQMANHRRGAGFTEKRQPTAKSKARLKAIKDSWAKAQAERHTKVAGCNACHDWFPNFARRDAHLCTKVVAPGRVG